MSRALILLVILAGCGQATSAPPGPDAATDQAVLVRRLADEYVAAFFEWSPESATRRGIPGTDHGRVTDNSLEAVARWQAREEAWLAQVRTIEAL